LLHGCALPLTAWTVEPIIAITSPVLVTAAVVIAHSLPDAELVTERPIEVLFALITVLTIKSLITDAGAEFIAAAVLAARWVATHGCASRPKISIITVTFTIGCAYSM
jgi:hypothetical protein